MTIIEINLKWQIIVRKNKAKKIKAKNPQPELSQFLIMVALTILQIIVSIISEIN